MVSWPVVVEGNVDMYVRENARIVVDLVGCELNGVSCGTVVNVAFDG
jgi:hypothetical protein